MAAQSTRDMAREVKAQRLNEQILYVSNLRSCLTALVVLHHTAVSYGGEGAHMFRSARHPPGSSVVLVGFNAMNQSFFMGSFFFLAGHYSKKSMQRKSRGGFIKGRLYRLGLPTLAYSVIAPPLCQAIVQLGQGEALNWPMLLERVTSIRGVRGPVWFTAVLILFDLSLALLEPTTRAGSKHHESSVNAKERTTRSPHMLGASSFVVLLSAVDFAWRIWFPVNRMFRPLNLNWGYLAQYIASYWFGTRVVSPSDAILPFSINMRLLGLSLASGLALVSAFQQKGNAALKEMLGGLGLSPAAYAVWNNAIGYLLGNALLALFSRWNVDLGRINLLAFSAFLVHIPTSVLIQVLADDWQVGAVTKTLTVGPLNIVASWIVGYCADTAWEKVMAFARTFSGTTIKKTSQK